MKRFFLITGISIVAVAIVFAQQTLPSRDGASLIANGSGTLTFAVDTSGNGTITPSGGTLTVTGTLAPSVATGSGIPVLSSGAMVTNLTVTSGAISSATFSGTTVAATTSLAVGSGTAILKILSAAATLDFGSVPTNQTADLTITVTGAGTNSVVILGLPAASDTNFVFNGFVSATNTVTVRAANISTGAVDPAAGSFRATVFQY